MIDLLWLSLPLIGLAGFQLGKRRALSLRGPGDETGALRVELNSLPGHYGQFVLVWALLPPLALLLLHAVFGTALEEGWAGAQLQASGQLSSGVEVERVLSELRSGMASLNGAEASGPHVAAAETMRRIQGVVSASLAVAFLATAAGALFLARRFVRPDLRARAHVERALQLALLACSVIAILTTIGIVGSLLFEALRFFQLVDPLEFFVGLEWSPQTALRADQVGSSGAFGAVPVFAGTLLITALAMLIAGPVGLMAAIHLAFYAGDQARSWIKPLLEVIAGIPTVVWGSFAALTLGPLLRRFGGTLGLDVASESALAAGLAMGVMIIPFVSSLSDDALNAVPRSLREGSLAMGATESETIRKVMVPAALPGIVGAFLLAVSRAIGETMIVVMAAGLAANLTANPFAAVTTVTVQIVTLLTGDQEFDSAKTLAAFALGLTLFFVTLALNLIALGVVRRFREQYE